MGFFDAINSVIADADLISQGGRGLSKLQHIKYQQEITNFRLDIPKSAKNIALEKQLKYQLKPRKMRKDLQLSLQDVGSIDDVKKHFKTF